MLDCAAISACLGCLISLRLGTFAELFEFRAIRNPDWCSSKEESLADHRSADKYASYLSLHSSTSTRDGYLPFVAEFGIL